MVGFGGRRSFGLPVADQFYPDEQSAASDVPDERMLLCQFLQLVDQVSARLDGVFPQQVFFDGLQDGESNATGDWVPTVLSRKKDKYFLKRCYFNYDWDNNYDRVVLTVLKYSMPVEAKLSAISSVVTTHEMGCPFPMGLPMVTMSGTTSAREKQPCFLNKMFRIRFLGNYLDFTISLEDNSCIKF